MIRLSTMLWFGLAAVTGFGLFHLKYEVQALEDELIRLNRSILAEQQAVHVLKAEWSYVNQPQRLQALANRHLDLRPMRPEQLGGVADLPVRAGEDANSPAAPKPGKPGPPAAKAPINKSPGRSAERPAAAEMLDIARQPPAAPAGQAQPVLTLHPATNKERR